jgi:hypothetical protein
MPQLPNQESRIVKNFRVGLIEILIKSNRYQIRAEDGDFNLSVPGRSLAVYLDRGQLYDPDDPDDEPNVQYDQDQPMTGSFSCQLRDMHGDTFVTSTDFITRTGQMLEQWGTELRRAGPDSPKLCTIQWWMKGNRVGDPRNKGIRCRFCNLTGSPVAEGSPNKASFSFTSYSVYPEPARWEA